MTTGASAPNRGDRQKTTLRVINANTAISGFDHRVVEKVITAPQETR
jgi:hypothetical protein